MAGTPFDWSSLITPAVALGSKALGDAVAPSADLKSVKNTAQQNAFNNKLALQKMAQANQIRQSMMPGMYTNLGFSPTQGQQMAGQYSETAAAPPTGGMPGSAPGLGSKIAKGAAGVGLSMAPAIIGHAATATSAATGLGGLGATGSAIGALASNPFTIAGAAALGAGLIWKKSQVHPIADKWVQGEQAPFDNHMRLIDQQNLPPAQAQAAKHASAQNYLMDLVKFAQGGGKNAIVARNAVRSFRQVYGDPSQYGVQVPF